MLIYIFAEHYPNPYKPQFDTEFAFFLRQGHDIKIFAAGKYTSTIHPRVREHGLDKKTSLVPATLKALPKFFWPVLYRFCRTPQRSIERIRTIYDRRAHWKQNLIRAVRVMLLPEEAPDLCYIHNIVTAQYFDFLNELYPTSRHAMYFHGGEVGGVRRVLRDAELFDRAQVVLTNSDFSRMQAIQRGCPADRAVTVPVGFDLGDYPCSGRKRYKEGGKLRLISVGRLSEEKGLLFALKALAELVARGQTALHYTIVGRGDQEGELAGFVSACGLNDYVAFVGEDEKSGVVARLEQSDVLILPSLITETWAETQAAVVQEAMFMQVLVIGTQAGGVPESTAKCLLPFSVPVADASAIASMIDKILSLPQDEMERLAETARSFATAKFDIESTGLRLLDYAMEWPKCGK